MQHYIKIKHKQTIGRAVPNVPVLCSCGDRKQNKCLGKLYPNGQGTMLGNTDTKTYRDT